MPDIIAYSVDLVYPGRVPVQGPSEYTVILPEEPYWEVTARFRRKTAYDAQGLYNRLKSGQTVSVNLDALRLPTIPVSLPVTSSSLGGDYLELRVGTGHEVVLNNYLIYDGKLVQTSFVSADRVRVVPRPSVLPSQGRIQPATSIDCWLPQLSAPSTYRYPHWGEITLTLRTL